MTIFEEIQDFIYTSTDIPEDEKNLKTWAKSSDINTGVFAVYMLCKQYNAICNKKINKGE